MRLRLMEKMVASGAGNAIPTLNNRRVSVENRANRVESLRIPVRCDLTLLIPFAARHECIRARKRRLSGAD